MLLKNKTSRRNGRLGYDLLFIKYRVKTNVDNYRGVTILPIMENVFETAVYRRLSFVNELLGEVDPYNGGFLTGVRTTDNLFILQDLIQRQLMLNISLYVCFIDFSKAFDMINRNILFYKLMNGSWQGRWSIPSKMCTLKQISLRNTTRNSVQLSITPWKWTKGEWLVDSSSEMYVRFKNLFGLPGLHW